MCATDVYMSTKGNGSLLSEKYKNLMTHQRFESSAAVNISLEDNFERKNPKISPDFYLAS